MSDLPSLEYIPNFVGPNLQAKLMNEIDANEWNLKLTRRTQHYVHEYDYKSKNVLTKASPMPKYIGLVGDHLIKQGVLDRIDQVIVNEYTRKQGISAHIDKNVFGPTIAIVTLNSADEMIFRKGDQSITYTLEPGSLAIIEGELRTEWTHEIKSLVGKRPHDFRRISVTYRTMV
jgi:alkylated DNA repair dioxygenase AlkB